MTTTFAERPRITGFIYDPVTGHNVAQLDSVGDIYGRDGEGKVRKIASATREGKLYDLEGNFTGLYLGELHPANGDAQSSSEKFKRLAK